MPNELPIPPAGLLHPSAEIIRVWLANEQQHVVLKIGFWEDRGVDERHAWGLMLADMIHHIANAHHKRYGRDPRETVVEVRKAFEAEMDYPTSKQPGEFLQRRPEGE